MKPGQVLIYLVIFLILGGFYYLYDIRLAEKETELEKDETRVFRFDVNQVRKIKYRSGTTDFIMQKDETNDWRIIQPIETKGDKWIIEGLIRRAASGKKDRIIPDPEDLARFGLGRPALSLSFMGGPEDREPAVLAPALLIGDKNPVEHVYYARLSDAKEVFTVNAAYCEELDQTLFGLRDKSVVMFPGEKMDGLRLTNENGDRVELKKKSLRGWDIVKPDPGPADDDLVQKIIYQALKGRVKQFASPSGNVMDYGFDRPRLSVQVLSGGETVAEVAVGRPLGEPSGEQEGIQKYYWVRSTERPEIFKVSSSIVGHLDKNIDDLKDRHLVDLDWRSITALKAAWGESRLEAELVDENWKISEPADPVSDDRLITSFLVDLLDLKYVRAAEAGPDAMEQYGLNQPALSIELTGPDEKKTILTAGLKSVAEGLTPMRVGAGPVVLVKRNDLIKILPQEVKPKHKEKTGEEPQGGQ